MIIIKTLCLIVLMTVLSAMLTTVHESIHKAIYDSYGYNSTIKYGFLRITGFTSTQIDKTIPQMELAHNLNEIMDYYTGVIVTSMVIIGGLIWFKEEIK